MWPIFSMWDFVSWLNDKMIQDGSETLTQPAITCSKLTIETLEQGVKYVQN